MSSDRANRETLLRAIGHAESTSGALVASLAAAWRRAFPDQRLEDVLECPQSSVIDLCLCLRPRADKWAADVEEIALTLRLDVSRLAGFLRSAEVAERLAVRQFVDERDERGLLAARDREEEEP